MAAPVFRAAGAKSVGTTGAVTVSAPTGVATDDLEILIAECATANTISITNNGGSSWSAMTGTPVTVTGGERLYVWSRVRQSGDGNPQVQASADHLCACRLAYQTGTFDPSDPFEIETTSNETTSDTSFSWAPGTSTTGIDRVVLVISTILRDSNTASVPVCTNANLTSLASRANYCTTQGNGGGFGCTEGTRAASGAVGTFACTYLAASAKAYISFAIKPYVVQQYPISIGPVSLSTSVTTWRTGKVPRTLSLTSAVAARRFTKIARALSLASAVGTIVEKLPGGPQQLQEAVDAALATVVALKRKLRIHL